MSERFEFLAVFSSLVPTGGRLRGGSGVLFLCLARTFRRGFLLDVVFSQMRTVFWPKALSVRTRSAFFLLFAERTKLEKTAGIWRKTLLAGFGRKGWWRGVCSLGSACARFCGPPAARLRSLWFSPRFARFVCVTWGPSCGSLCADLRLVLWRVRVCR